MKKWFLICFLAVLCIPAFSQGYLWGVKGGLTVGFQKWDGVQRDALLRYHGVAFIESYSEENLYSVFAQAGYHVKGSALRYRQTTGYDPISGIQVTVPARSVPFEFKNASLTLGMKRKYSLGASATKAYYTLGLRGEYTIATNLQGADEYAYYYSLSYPSKDYVRHWNFGVTVGGGFDIPFSDFMGGMIELNVSPDFSKQYYRPPVLNIYDPFTRQNINYPEQSIRNVSIELSIGLHFLRKVEYVD